MCVDCKVSIKHYEAFREDVCVDLTSSAADAPEYVKEIIEKPEHSELLIMVSHCVICVNIIDLFMHIGRL